MIIVLWGVPGSGKTHLYNEKYSHLPHCDVADVYEGIPGIDWDSAAYIVATDAKGYEDAVIEGLYLPGTPSRQKLEMYLRGEQVEWIQCHAPYDVCLERIKARKQSNESICIRILDRYWQRADDVYRTSPWEERHADQESN